MENKDLFITIVVALLAISEALAFIPKVKSNGIFQAIIDILKYLIKKK